MGNDMSNTATFEQAMQELENIVNKLDSGDASLEDAIRAYEEGVRLSRYCANKLSDAKLRIDKISTEHRDTTKDV